MNKSRINYYISQLSNRKVNKQNLMNEVLSSLSYQELQAFKKKTPSLFQGLLRVPYLKRKAYADIFKFGRVLLEGTKDPYGAIAFIVQNNAEAINSYIELKNQLDVATATNQYDKAYCILERIEKEISSSMTGTYYLLKLTRLDKGITASTQLHNRLCKENQSLSFISNMALKSASIDMPFEAEIEQRYRSLHGDDEIKDFITAFAFPYKNLNGDSWLKLLPYTSIIDLYEGLVLQLSKLTPNLLKDNHIRDIVSDLSILINDVRIKRYNELLNNDIPCSRNGEYDEEMSIVETYYRGDYEAVARLGIEYLQKYPLQSTILDVYIRSCVKLDEYTSELYPKDSLADKVYNLYIMASINDDVSEICKTQLRNICMAWFAIPCMRHFYTLFDGIDNTRRGNVYYRFWSYSLVPEIRDTGFYDSTNESVSYLEKCGYSHDDSKQIAILKGYEKDRFNQTLRLLKGINSDDLQSLIEDIEKAAIFPGLIGNIVSQSFDQLTEMGRFSDAVSLFVPFRLKNPFVRIIIDRQRITKEMTDDQDRMIKNQLELSAFYTMINSDIYKRYLAYKRYLKEIGVAKASEIDAPHDLLHQYFLGKVADRSVLTLHIRQFDTEDDVDAERIELCKKVYDINNEKSYADEITSLIKEHEVRALAQQVNDSKIHVDVQSLINTEFDQEKLMFETYQEIDDNLVMFEQKNMEGLIEYLKEQYEGKTVVFRYELPSVKYKKVLFRQMVLSVRDKFLFDPRYGLDKYLSARIRHGTLLTQLRNHFLSFSLVTNKKEGGEYIRTSPWTLRRDASLSNSAKERINTRLLKFTEWLDGQLLDVKEERIQIQTERNDSKKYGLFNYSEEYMADSIDGLEENSFETFDAFIHTAIEYLWKWTGDVLQQVRLFFQHFQEGVLEEMVSLQNDIVPLMAGSSSLANSFKDAITSCRTDFQTDISIVTSWFKPEQSKVRYFTVQQAVDTSLSVINKINQNALSFSVITINDKNYYSGGYFNAFHDVFHDMMNNILGYEAKRPEYRGKGQIVIKNQQHLLSIEMSNPVDDADIPEIESILREQQNFQSLIAGGKTRKEKNSGCVKIYSTVMYTLGGISYENNIQDNHFVARIVINTNDLEYHEDSVS